jgi:hypothetical protein
MRFRYIVKKLLLAIITTGLFLMSQLSNGAQANDRWSEKKANEWYQKQDWLVGANFLPSNAINELEMWQADTFDEQEIDKELGWAESLGMNTMRVFLHDLLWKQDSEGFEKRLDGFLKIAARHHIRPMLVLFDSCWEPEPKCGPQRPPVPGVHNSGWVQSPGLAMTDPSQYPRLEQYVKGVVGAFANDERIIAWDIWNEPNNTNDSSYGAKEPKNKLALVEVLLPKAFEWARSANPVQPLTSGVWDGDWAPTSELTAIQKIQFENSDVITFHNYGWPEDFEQRVKWLQKQNRPLICTEYMARPVGSIFDLILPIAKAHKVGVMNWGFVAGKSQTNLPWDSWQKPYVVQPPPMWFHDIFHTDGTPYRPAEVEFFKQITESSTKKSPLAAHVR